MRKAIVSMRVAETAEYSERRNCIAYDYITTLEARDLHVILVPNNTKLARAYLRADDVGILVLTGGNTVAGRNASAAEVPRDVYPERDRTERELLELALKMGVPVLGICRGAQFLNVHFGGTLTSDIGGHAGTLHQLTSPHGFLNGKVVNSYHNQGIGPRDLAAVLEPIASSGDGYIEAFRHPAHRIVGIMWHPERDRALALTGLLDDILRRQLGVTGSRRSRTR